MFASLNGEIGAENLTLKFDDPTFLRGEGVFETIRYEAHRICLWDEHEARLRAGAAKLGFQAPSAETMATWIHDLARHAQKVQGRIRVTCGRDCLITLEDLPQATSRLDVVISSFWINESSPLAEVKCTSYSENMVILRQSGADEVIRPNSRGELCEGCISNVFFLKGGTLHTPALATGCLPGVMRAALMRQAKVIEGRWPITCLDEAEEIWLTNAIRRIRAVTSLNGRALPAPQVGRIAALNDAIASELKEPNR